MSTSSTTLLGRGIYGVTEAARLARMPESTVRRWVRGYRARNAAGKTVAKPPVVGNFAHGSIFASSLSFADLMEVVHMEHFVREGVRFTQLRAVAARAKEVLECSHPFSTCRFVTDGASVLHVVPQDRQHRTLLNLLTSQYESEPVLRKMLRGDFDISKPDNAVAGWWPLSRNRDVVLDPARRFGAPISSSTGIPTYQLAQAYRAEGSYAAVASWYEISASSVRDAVRFEKNLASA